MYTCVYIHVYIQAVYIKTLGSYLDEKPQYFPISSKPHFVRKQEEVLPSFIASPHTSSKFLQVSEATDYPPAGTNVTPPGPS